MEYLIAVCLGIGLAVSSGFRIFMPFALLSLASLFNFIELNETFLWIGTPLALMIFIVATIVEILAYYFPYISNLLDTIEAPMAYFAGVILLVAVVPDMNPAIKWSVAIIAGGGVSVTTQLSTAGVRGALNFASGGIANVIVSTFEIIMSMFLAFIAILLPILVPLILILLFILIKKILKKMKKIKLNYQNKKQNKKGDCFN